MGSATFLLITLFLLGISLLQAAPRWERSAESDEGDSNSNSTSTSNSAEDAAGNGTVAASRSQPIKQPPMNRTDAFRYLKHYGYLEGVSPRAANTPYSRAMAVGKFQRMMGLPVTYNLDNSTMKEMAKPRCGFSDADHRQQNLTHQGRRKRYALEAKWDRTALTFSIQSAHLSGLSDADTRAAISDALKLWSTYTPLTFRELPSGGDINILFASRVHSNSRADEPFDGPATRGGSILAHAFLPTYRSYYNRPRPAIEGDVHIDADENWVKHAPSRRSQLSLYLVAGHEFGHSLGLGHTTDQFALMAPRYRYIANSPLNSDDIAGIRALYGSNTVTVLPPTSAPTPSPTPAPTRFPPFTPRPPVTRPTPAPATTRSPPVPGAWDYCRDPRIDAIATAKFGRGFTYAFRDNWFVRLTSAGVDSRGVRNINDARGLREARQYINNVNAAIFFSAGRELRVYTSNAEYKFDVNTGTGDLSYIEITPLPNTGNLIIDMDDLFVHPYWRFTYVFKGGRYSRLSSASGVYQAPTRGYPKDNGVWNLPQNLSGGIDAVTQWENNRVYVFKDTLYYRLQERNVGVDGGYPRGIADVWFGCNRNG